MSSSVKELSALLLEKIRFLGQFWEDFDDKLSEMLLERIKKLQIFLRNNLDSIVLRPTPPTPKLKSFSEKAWTVFSEETEMN